MKKGAMFGLDARIALAIFGALSVISGAALYSAIQSAKSEQARQFFIELEKASEAYYLDTGSALDQGNGVSMNGHCLLENCNNLRGWSGPYISGEKYGLSYLKTDFSKSNVASTAYVMMSLGKASSVTSSCVVGEKDCYEYYGLRYTGDIANILTDKGFLAINNIANGLDDLIDNGDGLSAGRVKLTTGGSGTSYNETVRYRSNISRVRY